MISKRRVSIILSRSINTGIEKITTMAATDNSKTEELVNQSFTFDMSSGETPEAASEVLSAENDFSANWIQVMSKIDDFIRSVEPFGESDPNSLANLKLVNLRSMKDYARANYELTNGKKFREKDELTSMLMCTNIDRIAKEMFEITKLEYFYNMFPLFFALQESTRDNEIWRLAIFYSPVEDDATRVNATIIAIQSSIDDPRLILKKDFENTVRDDKTDKISFEKDEFKMFFSCHLFSYKQWSNNPLLFRPYVFTFQNSYRPYEEENQPELKQYIDVSTFTLLGLYDNGPIPGSIGGFEGLDVNIVARIIYPHIIRNATFHQQMLRRKEEEKLTDEEVDAYENLLFVSGALSTIMTVPRSNLKKFMTRVIRIFKNVKDITEKEQANYEESEKLSKGIPDEMVTKV
jgi:hypothetical protein